MLLCLRRMTFDQVGSTYCHISICTGSVVHIIMEAVKPGLLDLPSEVIEIILQQQDVTLRDVLCVSQTCNKLRQVITNNSTLWLKKICNEWPDLKEIARIDLNWFEEYKHMLEIHSFCRNKIRKMSATYYWSKLSLSEVHLGEFLEKSELYEGLGHYYMVGFLRQICLDPLQISDSAPHTGLCNLTNQHYSMIILEYLIRRRLKAMWSILCLNAVPEKIAVFFDQWIDPTFDDTAAIFESRISRVMRRINESLSKDHPLRKIDAETRARWSTTLLEDNQFEAHVCRGLMTLVCNILTEEKLLSSTEPNMSMLVLKNSIQMNAPNKIHSSIVYEAVLRRCGVRCDLIYFSAHRFMMWRESWTKMSDPFLVDPFSGNMKMSTRCFFSIHHSSFSEKEFYTYSPTSLLLNLSVYMKDVTEFKQRYFKSTVELLNFLEPEDIVNICLLADIYLDLKKDTDPIRQKLCDLYEKEANNGEHIDRAIHITLNRINYANYNRIDCPISKKVIKRRTPNLKYAVGMICSHKLYGYFFIVRGWDLKCMATTEWKSNMGVNQLQFGENQPFYHVLAVDLTERYVAEENLVLAVPHRLYPIEERLAVEFSHFNDYFYIPNIEKEEEYPDDGHVRAFYKNKIDIAKNERHHSVNN